MSLCTVSGNLKTILGANSGPGTVRFTLTNLGTGNTPVVSGTGALVPLTTDVTVDATGAFSVALQGNDTITPSNTLYAVTFYAPNGAIGPNLYSITGSTFNLNTALATSSAPPVVYNNLDANLAFTGNNTFAGTTALNGGGSFAGTFTGNPTLSGNVAFTGNNTHSGTETFKQLNNVVAVDGTSITTIQACVTAAAALSTPGKCFVPTGTANTAQVEMASGVTLEFAPGTFINTGTSGGVFVHFASSVSGATVKGQGVGTTVLKNNSTGTQFGAVVQDEGTGNTVEGLTLDGNGNTTSTLIDETTVVRPHVRNVKIIADGTPCVSSPTRSYAWDFRGGSELDASDVEAQGGQLDAVQMGAQGSNITTITGGRIVNLYAHDSCHNGLDIKAQGTSGSVSGLVLSNLRLINNGLASGSAGDTNDDEFGLNLVATLAADGSSISNLSASNVVVSGNKGAGIVLKGDVHQSSITGVQSFSNGSGTATNKDSIVLTTASGSTAPVDNYIAGSSRKGSATNALKTDANTQRNVFILNTSSDGISLGSQNDWFSLQGTAGGSQKVASIDFGVQALAACPSAPGIGNVSGVGLCINSATTRFPGATGVELGGTIRNVGSTAVMGMTLKKGSGGGNYTNATTSYTVADSTNLCYTVTIPTGWKLGISASGYLSTATAAVVAQAALTDNAACSTANAGILVETAPIQGAGIGVADGFALNWVITGDGNAHNIALQFKTSNAADTASLINSSATVTPTIKFELMPSN